jgi:hypothetical protein
VTSDRRCYCLHSPDTLPSAVTSAGLQGAAVSTMDFVGKVHDHVMKVRVVGWQRSDLRYVLLYSKAGGTINLHSIKISLIRYSNLLLYCIKMDRNSLIAQLALNILYLLCCAIALLCCGMLRLCRIHSCRTRLAA